MQATHGTCGKTHIQKSGNKVQAGKAVFHIGLERKIWSINVCPDHAAMQSGIE